MKPRVPVPREAFARKPPHGSPCNACGVCCMVALCELGQHAFGRDEGEALPGPCPALMQHPEGYVCGIVLMAESKAKYEAGKLIIYAGQGCDARFNGEPVNEAFRRRCAEEDREIQPRRDAARRLWGIKESSP